MVFTKISIENKKSRDWFIEKSFLVLDINMEVVLKILFLFFSYANNNFGKTR